MIQSHRPHPFGLVLLVISLSTACAPDEVWPPEPELEWVSINATTVASAQTPLVVTLGYRDAQGDLGWEDPDVHALEIRDERLNAPDTYHIPPLTPGQAELSIDGTFVVHLPPLFFLGNGGDEQTRLTFRITDRAGHTSNAVSSPVILITDTL